MTNQTTGTMPSLLKLLNMQVKYQFKLFMRTPRLLVSAFLLPILILWIRHIAGTSSGASTANLIALGAVATFGVMSACFSTLSIRLVNARESGTLKRLRGAPLPPVVYFLSQIIASVGLALLAIAVTVAFGYTEHIHLAAHAVPTLILSVIIGALTWAALGTAVSTLFHDVASAQGLLQAILLPLVFFSGVFFPTTDEPHWLATLASWLPAQPFVDMLSKSVLLTHGWLVLPIRDILTLAVWTIVSIIVAVYFFSWEPYRAAGHTKRKQNLAYDK